MCALPGSGPGKWEIKGVGGWGEGIQQQQQFKKKPQFDENNDYITKLCHSKFKTAGAILIDSHGKQHKMAEHKMHDLLRHHGRSILLSLKILIVVRL